MQTKIVYKGKVICNGVFAPHRPQVGDFLQAGGIIVKVEAVMFDCTENNRGDIILYVKDVMSETEEKLKYC